MMTRLVALIAFLTATASIAVADGYSPNLSELAGLGDLTSVWAPTQTSTFNSLLLEEGSMEHNVTWDATGEGYARVVLQRGGLERDLSAYDSFDFVVEAIQGDVTIQPFIQTGPNWSFFGAQWNADSTRQQVGGQF